MLVPGLGLLPTRAIERAMSAVLRYNAEFSHRRKRSEERAEL